MPSRRELANAIRALSMDAVQRAKSGHPGAPMGMADIAEVLWNDFLQHNPTNPNWCNRDRFVLSNGHGSMLLYSLLHLAGYELSIDDLKDFRQLHSKTPGHPEYAETPGVETTTGPLGQGLANAVGMALGEKILAQQFNRKDHNVIDHFTYVFAGDGCLMEGVSHEVCSLAGTHKLGKLIVFYDDNDISIDGKVGHWFTDNTPQRFEAYGWQVIKNVDGHDGEAVKAAITAAKGDLSRPTIICCKTVIGFGAPNKAGTHGCHGAPLGDEEIAATREQLNWPHAPFEVPNEIYQQWDAKEKGQSLEQRWQAEFEAYQTEYPDLAAEFLRRVDGKLPADWSEKASAFIKDCFNRQASVATRKASLTCLNEYVPQLPELLGGSADLTDSNLTKSSQSQLITAEDASGDYLSYGVREFGMSAIMNGLALHGGFIPFGGTFLTFMEYAHNAVRLSALMQQKVIYVYTHDSVGLGEDGPTHQPIEQLTTLRLIPNLNVWRPCDEVESAVAWKIAIEQQSPSALIFSRQTVPFCARDVTETEVEDLISRGGYIFRQCSGTPKAVLIATGSELPLAFDVAKALDPNGECIQVVSMPCPQVFLQQDKAYRDTVLPIACKKRVAIEAGVTPWWHQLVGDEGLVLGVETFGASAPGNQVFEHFGLTVENVQAQVEKLIN